MSERLWWHVSRITHPTQVLIPWFRRLTLIPHTIISFAMFWGAMVDKGSFTAPVFAPIFEWADLTVWALMFLISGIACVIAIFNNSWKMYFLGNISTLSLSLLWLAALIDARFHQGYIVSTAAFGLWGFVVATCVVLAVIPTRVIRTR